MTNIRVISKGLSTSPDYGVPATVWVVASIGANLIPMVTQQPGGKPQLAPSVVRVAGFLDLASLDSGKQPLGFKTYTIPPADVVRVLSGGTDSVYAFILSQPDFVGATTA